MPLGTLGKLLAMAALLGVSALSMGPRFTPPGRLVARWLWPALAGLGGFAVIAAGCLVFAARHFGHLA
jgi:hypothetical protein